MKLFDKLFGGQNKQDFPPTPKWKPDLPIYVDQIVDRAKYYTGNKMQFAVFKYGTVAFFLNKVENIQQAAFSTLTKIYNSHPDFNPMEMDDGNYIIQYSQPAFTVVFKKETQDHWGYIDLNHIDGICRDEVLINAQGQRNVFDKIGKICLYGRAKMFMDAQAPTIITTFNP